jgi:3-oxoadipate enol-lactonase
MPSVKISDVEMYYEVIGSGKEILISCRMGQFQDDMLSLFPPEYRVYLLDLPGYGKSTKMDYFRGFKQWAQDIYQFAQALKIDKFVYSGMSMMGIVGFQLALDYPEALKALILIVSVPVLEPPSPHPEEQKAIEAGDAIARVRAGAKTLVFPTPTSDKSRLQRREKWYNQQIASLQAAPTSGTEAARRGILSTNQTRRDMVSRLGDIKVPTLLLFGAQDRSNPVKEAITSAMSIPKAKAVFFQDYGHGLHVESPDKVVGEITSFITEVNRTSRAY